ncbi:MAG: alpha/beta hydrolase [Ruminiclostridium sp.]|nr:alpha/beta hydrolase [Ruminiclostridium sp.]
MNIKKYYLNSERTVIMKTYLLDQVETIEWCRRRPAILILPGGGYEYCSEREAEPVAMQYLAQGYNAFVLYYTVGEKYPAALRDAAYALCKIRLRADEFGIDPHKIAVWGASSGGHLAGCLATMWNDPKIAELVGCTAEEMRPNAVILSYPVISGIKSPHKGSFDILIGKDAEFSELSRLSLENRVSPKTPPVFIWCTADDDCVSAQNSILMAKACISNKVPVELHIFDKGPHGLSTCDKASGWNESYYNENCRQWIDMSVKFLERYMKV